MRAKMGVMAVVIGLAWTMGGCANLQKKIDQLEEDNRNLQAQLATAQDQLNQRDAELMQTKDALATARGQMGSLEKDLLAAQKMKAQLPPNWVNNKGMIMTSLPNKVLFDPGKEALKSGGPAKLNQIITEINQNFPGYDVYVIGHTDTDPIQKSKWHDNLELSQARSSEVVRYLKAHGIAAKRLIAGGCGEYRPIADNKKEAGKAKNRRVEFWVLKPTG